MSALINRQIPLIKLSAAHRTTARGNSEPGRGTFTSPVEKSELFDEKIMQLAGMRREQQSETINLDVRTAADSA